MRFRAGLWLALALSTPQAFASIIAYDYPTLNSAGAAGNAGNQDWVEALGMDFQVNQNIVVSQLGAFYSGLDTIANGTTLTISLYSQSNETTPLAQATFTQGDQGTLVGGQYMKDIDPVFLSAGLYTIVAIGYNDQQQNGNRNVTTGAFNPAGLNDGGGAITFLASTPYGGSGYPNTPFSAYNNEFGAGTFAYTVVNGTGLDQSIPEPGTVLFLAGGLAGMVLRRRIAA